MLCRGEDCTAWLRADASEAYSFWLHSKSHPLTKKQEEGIRQLPGNFYLPIPKSVEQLSISIASKVQNNGKSSLVFCVSSEKIKSFCGHIKWAGCSQHKFHPSAHYLMFPSVWL